MTLTGQDFQAPVEVTIGSGQCTITFFLPPLLKCTVPVTTIFLAASVVSCLRFAC